MVDFQIENGTLVKYEGKDTYVTLPENVTVIGDEAFSDCKGLVGITLPKGLESIEDYAFCNCDNMADLQIPDSVTHIGRSAFSMCTEIEQIEIPDSVQGSIGERTFFYCTALSSVKIGNGVTSIANDAFRECTSLSKITIHNSVQNIGENAFEGCGELTICTEIGSYAAKYAKSKGIKVQYLESTKVRFVRFLLTLFLGFIGSMIINRTPLQPVGYTSRTEAYLFLGWCTAGIYQWIAAFANLFFDSERRRNVGYISDYDLIHS